MAVSRLPRFLNSRVMMDFMDWRSWEGGRGVGEDSVDVEGRVRVLVFWACLRSLRYKARQAARWATFRCRAAVLEAGNRI